MQHSLSQQKFRGKDFPLFLPKYACSRFSVRGAGFRPKKLCPVLVRSPADVLHGDLAVPPSGGCHEVELLPAESPEGVAEIPSVRREAEDALVHVEHRQEPVRRDTGLAAVLVRLGVWPPPVALRVVVHLVPDQVPPPGVLVPAHQVPVAPAVQWSITGGYPDNGISAPLSSEPRDLKDVQPAPVAHLAADAVGGLRHRVPAEGQRVVVLDEDVVGAVLAVPRMLQLDVLAARWHVKQHLQPRWGVHPRHGGVLLVWFGSSKWTQLLLESPIAKTCSNSSSIVERI